MLSLLGRRARSRPDAAPAALAVLADRLRPGARDLASAAAGSFAELSSEEGSGDDAAPAGGGGCPAIAAHVARMDETLAAGRPSQRRSLAEYNALIGRAMQERRSFLLQDIFDEMALDGVAPSWESYGMALSAFLMTRTLAPAHHFFCEMRRHGFHPTAGTLSVIIATAGHAGQLRYALRLVEQMQERNIPISDKIQRALLSCYANTHEARNAMALLDEFIMTRTRVDVHLFMETIRSVRTDATNKATEAARREAAAHIEAVIVKAMEHLDLESQAGDRDALLMSAQDAYNRLGMFDAARDAFAHMVQPSDISLRSHFASFLEEAKVLLDATPASPAGLQRARACVAEAMGLLHRMEAQGVQLKLFHTANFVLTGVQLEEQVGEEPIAWQAPDGERQAWTVVQMCVHVLEHIANTGHYISEAYGSRMLRAIAGCKRGSLLRVADHIFDGMDGSADVPGRSACALYARAKQQHAPGDAARIERAVTLSKTYRDPRSRRRVAAREAAGESLEWEPGEF